MKIPQDDPDREPESLRQPADHRFRAQFAVQQRANVGHAGAIGVLVLEHPALVGLVSGEGREVRLGQRLHAAAQVLGGRQHGARLLL